MRKKILYYAWNDEISYDLEINLEKVSDVKVIQYSLKDYSNDSEFFRYLQRELEEEIYDAIFTYDFFPIIAKVAFKLNVKYISWIYDCPHTTLYSQMVYSPYNYFFVFDGHMAKEMQGRGIERVVHMPLAVDVERLGYLLADVSGYQQDISFMGNLYTDEHNYLEQIKNIPEYTQGYVEGLVRSQANIYGYSLVDEAIKANVLQELEKRISLDMSEEYEAFNKKIFLSDMLHKSATIIERADTVRKVAVKFGNLTLYSQVNPKGMPNVTYKGVINYLEQMPYMFRTSKINLNMTLRSIQTGIPLRCLDIMGAGGFLLSSYQEELAMCFENGTDLVLYACEEELYELIAYYLNHDAEREQIAQNGHEKVKRMFTFKIQLQKIFELVFGKMEERD